MASETTSFRTLHVVTAYNPNEIFILTMLGLSVIFDVMWQGQATDIMIQAEEIIKMKKLINGLYVKHTNQSMEVIGTSTLDKYVQFMS